MGGGLFGGTTTTRQPATGGGLFGSTSTTQQPATGGGLFGSNPPTNSQLRVAVYPAVRPHPSNQLLVVVVFSAGEQANSQLRLAVFLGAKRRPLNPAAGICLERPNPPPKILAGVCSAVVRRLARVQVAVAYLEVARRNRLAEACLGVRRPPRRILTTCLGVASNSNPIHLKVPLMRIRFWAVSLGTVP